VKKVFSLSKVIKDELSLDGTTAFLIALAKEYNNVLGIFLDRIPGQCSSLYVDVENIKENKVSKHEHKVHHRWV
jgi:hypothetical protein